MPAFQPPLPYTVEEEKLKRRQALASAMLSNAITPQSGYTSWAQVLGQIANAAAGKYNEDRTDNKLDALDQRERSDYATALAGLNKDAAGGMSPSQIVAKYNGNPLVQDALKPYQEAMAQGLKSREELVKFGDQGGYRRAGDIIGQPLPSNPDDAVINVNGRWQINPVRMTAALGAQGLPVNNPATSMPAPPLPGNPNNIQAAPPGQTQGGGVQMPTTPTPVAPAALTATGPNGQKLRFNPNSMQWEPLTAGGPMGSAPSGGF